MASSRPQRLVLAAGLSLLLPGLGHFYLGRTRLSLALAIGFAIGVPVLITVAVATGSALPWLMLGLVGGSWVFRLIVAGHAAWLAREPRAPSPATDRLHTPLGYAAFVVIGTGLALVGAAGVRMFVLEPFTIPSASNQPTLDRGDHIVVTKLLPRDHAAVPGDLVVFPLPSEPTETFVKRVIATAGQTVEVVDGTVRIDGVALPRTPCEDGTPACYVERTPEGAQYRIQHMPHSELGPVPPTTIPAGHVWVLGDNRGNSLDSVQFGPIPADGIQGRVRATWWPLERARAHEP